MKPARDPRDLAATFGSAYMKDGLVFAGYDGSELSLRRSLATIAHAWGWLVEEEVVVPGWGRIDLVLRGDHGVVPQLVELKLDLTKPAAIRRAFRQADGYGRWWAQRHGETANVVLAGASVDSSTIGPIADAYPAVCCISVSGLMRGLSTLGHAPARLLRADSRSRELEVLAEVYRHAREGLGSRITAEQAKAPATGPGAGVAGVDVAAPAHTPDP